MRYVFLVL
uniref:Uncharacterized protein n=1 Tax=Arundo donax TaxID=35708 RepID=A0A0A9CAP0_ARUDO